ncbi:hypothetical protein SAMN05216553_101348 [Lentzea fradiae]|uniref:PKD domain-containing protein n=1 Tax=Lentzea fradiae TaxID=200378 RepID=A0A1G7KL67_9PSEU|nr:hypothetical protein [Lentzea fradiae]SDF37851.1 hypothetical protein SAMN05216553_101348 [Lentzea fradiae]
MIGAAALLAAVLAPAAAHAAPPANDDFSGATPVTALPFTSTVDTKEGTAAADDPQLCWWSTSSVWYRYTAPADGFVAFATDREEDRKPAVSVYTGDRGALSWAGACQYPHGGGSDTFAVKAGTTYHLLVQDTRYAGPVTLSLTPVPRAANDDLAAAADVPLDTDVAGDTGPATVEQDEVEASCDTGSDRSLWYRYTTGRERVVAAEVTQRSSAASVAVFRKSDLTEVECRQTSHAPAIFTATPGETYYVRIANSDYDAAALTLRLSDAPGIAPALRYFSPARPGVFDEIVFEIDPGDPAGRWLAGGEVRFGDGAAAAIPAVPGTATVSHRYAADGEYDLTVSGYTADGRSGSTTRKFKVETHDVTVADLVAPATATAGSTGDVTVSVSTTRYDEDIVVELLRRLPTGYWTVVGTADGHVAKNGTTVVPFTYTYTGEDAAIGKATLKARVRLASGDDNNPADNERVAETTVTATR